MSSWNRYRHYWQRDDIRRLYALIGVSGEMHISSIVYLIPPLGDLGCSKMLKFLAGIPIYQRVTWVNFKSVLPTLYLNKLV
jgi:hypothetical protein